MKKSLFCLLFILNHMVSKSQSAVSLDFDVIQRYTYYNSRFGSAPYMINDMFDYNNFLYRMEGIYPPECKIDFDSYMLVIVHIKTQRGGSSVQSVSETNTSLQIKFSTYGSMHYDPEEGEYNCHVIKVKKSTLPIEVVVSSKVSPFDGTYHPGY